MNKEEKIEVKYRVVQTNELLNNRKDGSLAIFKETIYCLLDINNLYYGVFDEELLTKHIDELFQKKNLIYINEDKDNLVVSREELLFTIGCEIEDSNNIYKQLLHEDGDNVDCNGNIYIGDGMSVTPNGEFINE